MIRQLLSHHEQIIDGKKDRKVTVVCQIEKETDRKVKRVKQWLRQNQSAGVAVWQHVCTAEHKLKKPRPLSHTPLDPKLHGVLHSTHKQRPGKALGCMGEAGLCQAGRQETTTLFSHQHNASKLQRRWRRRLETKRHGKMRQLAFRLLIEKILLQSKLH